jgi:hypothetical protein
MFEDESAYFHYIEGEMQRMIQIKPGWFDNERAWRKLTGMGPSDAGPKTGPPGAEIFSSDVASPSA